MKRVLIAPLDWGLGHATRCVPIIRELQEQNCHVFVAGSGESILLLRNEFPDLKFFSLPGYSPQYPMNGKWMPFKMAAQIPKFFKVISGEHKAIEKITRENQIDVVISDNRYGGWSSHVPSIFITHQSNILMPKRFGWMAGMVHRLNEKYMQRFTECWIPDYPGGKSLAGDLATFDVKNKSIHFRHVGCLSRFKRRDTVQHHDVLAIFSGPEPQRTALEKIVYPQLKESSLRYFVVRGKLEDAETIDDANVVNFRNADALEALVCSAEVVIARSGYSTVMDMAALGKKVIFIPTPGQTEQEYLASTLSQKNIACAFGQGEFNLGVAMEKVKSTTGFTEMQPDSNLLKQAIANLISRQF